MPEPSTWEQLFLELADKAGDENTYDEDDISYILWNYTPYPMGSKEQVATALERYFDDPEGVKAEAEEMFGRMPYDDGEDD
jgi:hypothetical protein